MPPTIPRDHRQNPTFWFAVLEIARERGDFERAAEAKRELKRLGVSIVYEPAVSRVYLERPRGHSKTQDIAIAAVWALAFATRPIRGYCYAADRAQAALLKEAMQRVVRLNPWIGSILDVQRGEVVNIASQHPGEGGTLRIEASDVGSSYGILADVIIADEVCHWQGDGALWHSLISSAAKRAGCLLLAISNAGFVDSWQ